MPKVYGVATLAYLLVFRALAQDKPSDSRKKRGDHSGNDSYHSRPEAVGVGLKRKAHEEAADRAAGAFVEMKIFAFKMMDFVFKMANVLFKISTWWHAETGGGQ